MNLFKDCKTQQRVFNFEREGEAMEVILIAGKGQDEDEGKRRLIINARRAIESPSDGEVFIRHTRISINQKSIIEGLRELIAYLLYEWKDEEEDSLE